MTSQNDVLKKLCLSQGWKYYLTIVKIHITTSMLLFLEATIVIHNNFSATTRQLITTFVINDDDFGVSFTKPPHP